jgi:hypothetical protein
MTYTLEQKEILDFVEKELPVMEDDQIITINSVAGS